MREGESPGKRRSCLEKALLEGSVTPALWDTFLAYFCLLCYGPGQGTVSLYVRGNTSRPLSGEGTIFGLPKFRSLSGVRTLHPWAGRTCL